MSVSPHGNHIISLTDQFIPAETCTVAGYSSRKEMKEAMYSRAKVLSINLFRFLYL